MSSSPVRPTASGAPGGAGRPPEQAPAHPAATAAGDADPLSGAAPVIEGVQLADLVRDHPTPLVAYSAARLRANAAELRAAFGAATRVMFSYKACYLPGVLTALHGSGIDGEVCSGHEYRLALATGLPPSRVTWNAVSLDDAELALAVRHPPHWLGLNTRDDLERVDAAARAAGTVLDVALRIHPEGIESSYLKRGQRLGFDVQDGSALAAARQVTDLPHLRLVGLHSHTQVRQTAPDRLVRSLVASLDFAAQVRRATGCLPGTVGIGGGLAGRPALAAAGTSAQVFADALTAALDRAGLPVRLAVEPGRFLVDDAAVGVTRILSRTRAAGTEWWIVDLGTQFLVPFEGREFPVTAVGPEDGAPRRTVGIGDRLSSYAGVIERAALLPERRPGDLLLVRDVGAYTMSTTQRFMYGMPEIVLVDGADVDVQWYPEDDRAWVARLMSAGRA